MKEWPPLGSAEILALPRRPRSSPVPKSGTTFGLSLPTQRSIAALCHSSRLPGHPVEAARHALEAYVGGGAFLRAVGHQRLGGTLAPAVVAENLGQMRAG